MVEGFFFQAEDGIRDADVTGVQTCALPISRRWARWKVSETASLLRARPRRVLARDAQRPLGWSGSRRASAFQGRTVRRSRKRSTIRLWRPRLWGRFRATAR